MRTFRIGKLSSLSGLSERSIRYYEEQGLIKSQRTEGKQRLYTDQDLVYLKRIIELKALGFSILEIKKIFLLKVEDKNGNKRREELLLFYRKKMEEDEKKIEKLENHLAELEWRIHQLEQTEDGFTECPGLLCPSCNWKDKCIFFKRES